MKHVKVMDARPEMVWTGTVERGDLPGAPFKITAVTPVGNRHFHIAHVSIGADKAGYEVCPGHARMKVID